MSHEIIIKRHPGGVTTLEGKEISRYNAQKHAILRESPTEYEKAEAEGLFNDLSTDLRPSGRMEELLVEMICSDLIKSQRIEKAESELIMETLHPDLRTLDFGGHAAKIPASAVEKLMLYSRYKTATQNRIFRALGVFKQLQHYEQN